MAPPEKPRETGMKKARKLTVNKETVKDLTIAGSKAAAIKGGVTGGACSKCDMGSCAV